MCTLKRGVTERKEQGIRTIGIGIDIETISRFGRLKRPEAFFIRFFAAAERDLLEHSDNRMKLSAVMWVVKEAVIKALWQQVQLLPSRIEVLPDGNAVQVAVHHEGVPGDLQISVEVTYPDDQVMAVVRVGKEE